MTQYRSKPVTLSAAAQWDGANVPELEAVAGPENVHAIPSSVQVKVADGTWVTLMPGWWVSDADGDITVSSDRPFRRYFEPVP